MRKGDKRARQSFIKETKKKGKAVKLYPLLILSIQRGCNGEVQPFL